MTWGGTSLLGHAFKCPFRQGRLQDLRDTFLARAKLVRPLGAVGVRAREERDVTPEDSRRGVLTRWVWECPDPGRREEHWSRSTWVYSRWRPWKKLRDRSVDGSEPPTRWTTKGPPVCPGESPRTHPRLWTHRPFTPCAPEA